MKITILCNNSVKMFCGCIAEHGFSAFVEVDGVNYLFDTGRGFGIVENSLMLNRDLHSIKAIILSHGHSDHCGGLEKVLKYRNTPTPVYAHPAVFSIRYAALGKKIPFVGIPFRREYLESLGAEFKTITDFTAIADNIFITGEVKRKNSFELPEKNLLVRAETEGGFETDPVLDDYSLIISTPRGLVLLLGCAHAGLVNIMSLAVERFKTDRIYAVIGGTHLVDANSDRVEKTIEALEEYKVQKIGTCHCTGPEKEAILKEKFRDRFFFAQTGSEITI
ncbi:MAG: MBL fold metallo-hydrolase [Vulcanimicrobiota bacterium]